MSDLTIRIRFTGEHFDNLRDHVDFTQLVGGCTKPLDKWELSPQPAHRLKVTFERTHEYEGVLEAILIGVSAGATLAATEFCKEFGKKMAGLIWEWAKSQLSSMKTQDKSTTLKSPDDVEQALGFTTISTSMSDYEVTILVKPK